MDDWQQNNRLEYRIMY